MSENEDIAAAYNQIRHVSTQLQAAKDSITRLEKENKLLRQQLELAEGFIPQQAKLLYQRAWNEY
jgi:peptidoglycan hydrolase CwlO-like protein